MSDPHADRGTGRTSRQMTDAPVGAYFVWCNESSFYPQRLAERLGRTDLQILMPHQIRYRLAGTNNPVVVDHAARLNDEQWAYVRYANAMAGYPTVNASDVVSV